MKPVLKLRKKPEFKSKTDRLREQYPTNDDIKSITGKVRVVDPETSKSEELPLSEALKKARDRDVDLVQISISTIPICKLIKLDKFLYQMEKQQKANVQHPKKNKLIKFTPNISDHDLEHKVKHIKEFLADGFKVELIIYFKGRERSHKEFGHEIFRKVVDGVGDTGKIEVPTRDNGSSLSMMMGKR